MIPDFTYGLSFLAPKDLARPTRDRVDQLSNEVASGLLSDPARPLNSDFSEVSRLTHILATYAPHYESLQRGQQWGAGLQAGLSRASDALTLIGEEMAVGLPASDTAAFTSVLATAKGSAQDIVTAMNTSVAGKGLFANGANGNAINDFEALFAEVGGLAASAGDFEAYAAAVDRFFDPGGGYDLRHAATLPPENVSFSVGDGDRVAFDIDNRDAGMTDALKQALLVAGLAQAGFDINHSTGRAILSDLQPRQLASETAVAAAQGRVGALEQRISDRSDIMEASRLAAEQRLNELLTSDPFEASVRLQEEMSRLETVYAITARRAQLRLTDYLR